MEEKLVEKKCQQGFLELNQDDGGDFYYLKTPCTIRLGDSVTKSIIQNYKAEEEVGGIFWANPFYSSNDRILNIESVSYIRNAIDDYPRKYGISKSNAYRPDEKQFDKEIKKISNYGFIPITFHTHPVESAQRIFDITAAELKKETSKQDVKESKLKHRIGEKELLMPRALIVGNPFSYQNLFIGIYSGLIAPAGFQQSKEKLREHNLEKIADWVSVNKLADSDKVLLTGGCVLLLSVMIHYRKYSFPLLFCLLALLPEMLTNIQLGEKPEYFNRLSDRDTDIFIPNSVDKTTKG